jgi:hypothetical protein
MAPNESNLPRSLAQLKHAIDHCRTALDAVEKDLAEFGSVLSNARNHGSKDESDGDRAARFRYMGSSEKILLNGCYVTRKIQARLLRSILRMHLHKGRLEFDYLEFKEDSGIFPDSKRSNLGLRLDRICGRLEKIGSPVKIKRIPHGRFLLLTKAEISLEE